MKKIALPLALVLVLSLYSFVNFQDKFKLHEIIGRLNEKQVEEIKKISIKDTNGFKYAQKYKNKGTFTNFVTTTSSQKITEEDEKKLQEIILKYK